MIGLGQRQRKLLVLVSVLSLALLAGTCGNGFVQPVHPAPAAPGEDRHQTAVAQRPLAHWGEVEHPSLRKLEDADGFMERSADPRPLAAASARETSWQALAGLKPAQVAQLSLLNPSGATAAELEAVLADTGLAGLGDAFVRAEEAWGVNALALVAIAAHESAWGKSWLARTRANLFGFGAYTGAPHRARRFDSREAGIAEAARHLRKQYLEPDGRYYKGTALVHVGSTWAHDPKWASKAAAVWRRLAAELVEQAEARAETGGE